MLGSVGFASPGSDLSSHTQLHALARIPPKTLCDEDIRSGESVQVYGERLWNNNDITN